MKKIFVLLVLISNFAVAQVSTITRNPASYTKEVFPFQGSRIVQVDEAHSPGNEENVFIFSKVERGAKPDVMHFQRFTKTNGNWTIRAKTEIRHDGIVVAIGNRKAFMDADKNKSVDALFIYSLNDLDLKQQSIHMLISQGGKIYTIAATLADGYQSSKFSDNFSELSPATKEAAMSYWAKLDKADK